MSLEVTDIQPVTHWQTLYWLSNGWFVARTFKADYRQYGFHFNLWRPGAGKDGTALRLGGAHTLTAITALANQEADRLRVRTQSKEGSP